MRRTAAAAVLTAIAVLLAGCAETPAAPQPEPETPAPVEITPEPPDERKSDEEFVAAVGRALQARWDLSSLYTSRILAALTAAEYQDYLRSCVAAEEAELGSILDYRFLDNDLAALAQRYYYALTLQRQGAEFARTDSVNDYNRTWVLGYNYRVAAIWELCSHFSLRVDEGYETRLSELLSTHAEAARQVAFQELIDRLPHTLRYEKDPARSDGDTVCFMGEVVNDTEYDIKSLSIDVSFLDAEGRILCQGSDWISNLHAGQSARSTIFGPAGDYAGMEYSISIYQ